MLFFGKETHSSFHVTVPLLSSQTSSCISVALHDDYTVRAKCYLYPLPKRAPFISAALSIQHLFCLIVSCSLSSLPCSCNMRSSISSVLGLPTNNRLINYTSQGHIRTQACAPLKFRVTRAFPLISSKNCQPQIHPDLCAPVEGTVETVQPKERERERNKAKPLHSFIFLSFETTENHNNTMNSNRDVDCVFVSTTVNMPFNHITLWPLLQ